MKKYILILMTYSVLLKKKKKMDTVTEETTGSINYQEPVITEYESDGMTYEKMSGESIEVTYPKLDKTFSDEDFVAAWNVSGTRRIDEPENGKSAYHNICMINWDGIYNDENIKSIIYTIYNSTCGFTDMSDDPDNYRKKNNINMKSMGVSGVDDNAIKLMIVVELPTSEDAFNRYMQSIYEEKQAMIKAVNNAIIEADVTYNDGTEKVEYYKIKTGKYAITTMDIYKQVE